MITRRRDFLKLLSLLGLSMHFGRGRVVLAADHETVTMRHPDRTGRLPAEAKDQLWSTFQHIGKIWQNGDNLNLTKEEFQTILDLKTDETPSYLFEYLDFVSHLGRLVRDRGEQVAKHHIFFEDKDPHRRTFVVAEMIELQLASGGFRVLGWQNYRGFPGGPYHLNGKAPYREAVTP